MASDRKIKNYQRSKFKSVETYVRQKIVKTKKLPDHSMELPMGGTPIADIVLKHVEVWTDGGCWKNPGGAGAWAAVLKFGEHRREMHAPVPAPTTNNICELMAVIEAVESIKQVVKLTIHTDSKYVISVATGARAKVNKDLVARLKTALSKHTFQFIWVMGHSGDPENECCDKLCRAYNTEKAARIAGWTPPAKESVDAKQKPVRPSQYSLENDEARRERERLQLEMDRAIGF